MARSFGRILAAIWDDDDFLDLSLTGQRLYMYLVSQDDLEHSGLIPLRERRWAKGCTALTPEQITLDIKELAEARFVVVDEDTEELLVRSLIRRDEVWKQPNVFKAAATSARNARSAKIKAALHAEVARLDLSSAPAESRGVREALLADLAPFANPSGTPSEPLADPSLREGRELRGKGSSNGLSKTASPSPLPLSPLPPADGDAAANGAASPPDSEGEGAAFDPDEVSHLVGEIKLIRPDWAARSIARALRDAAVAERPWPIVRAAALACARDPESQQPGRLAHDGPWWHQPAANGRAMPPKCDACSPSRRVEGPDGEDLGPCPTCHPSAVRQP